MSEEVTLYWDKDGTEHACCTAEEHKHAKSAGWTTSPPSPSTPKKTPASDFVETPPAFKGPIPPPKHK